ncbi:DotA/TraY family protein [Candidatus Berkiella aquae]|uniref:DotA/TraY family protein n=1 Tax=Candidatus Berkiella aquae TaxID=295108 RepID=A0A0Q9YMU3_9GAMM|nr:DotA/TraY family protein [Candidatus Berkiella aquae]MCS5711140.1 DotA/TraY family protein [Candidatus Berkiella aquae]
MNAFTKACALLLILGFPTLVFGVGAFEVESTDKSMVYLGMIFGYVPGTPIPSSGNSLFAQLVYIFNQVVFALGIVVIAYTAAFGAINTAHQGEFLGKDWHPVLVPLRAGAGILLLLPQTTGYNYMQIIVMWFIVQGVGAANAMWRQVIISNQTQGNLHQDTRKVDLQNASDAVSDIFKANICMAALNGNSSTLELMEEPVQFYRMGDQMRWGRVSQNDAICGSIDLAAIQNSMGGNNSNAESAKNRFANALIDAQQALETAADEALMPMAYGTAPTYSSANQFVSAARALQQAAVDVSNYTASLNDVSEQAIENGWILAGSYYFTIVQEGVYVPVTVTFSTITPNVSQISKIVSQQKYNETVGTALGFANTYQSTAYSSIVTLSTADRAGSSIVLKKANMSSQGSSIFAAIFGSLFEDIVKDLMEAISGSGEDNEHQNDPVISMASFGSHLAVTTENVFFAAFALAFALWTISTPLSCLQPLGHAFDKLLTIFMPIAVLLISLLWVAGLTLGLYIPMIPYLVFTFSALTWIILVIEAMLAAPLIALTLIVPSEDEIGKAGHAISILLGIFLRPALMILGFIMAMQLLIVAIGMLNAAFWATILNATGASKGVGVFGLIAILLMYAGVATGMVHEAFSLIYLVPNKVMRWIGASGEQDDAMSKVQELKGSVQKGGGMGAGLMKSGLKAFSKDKK